MSSVQVIPGLTVDQTMFHAAAAGLAAHAPGERLTWEMFTGANSWTLIPDPDGFGYKAECVLRREPTRTVKINLWMGPDLRDGQAPRPHNHPWEFTAHVLLGGYTEQRYELAGKAVKSTAETHLVGGQNHVPLSTFHEVTEIAEPGRTLTLMLCGEGTHGDWGYLDPETGKVTVNVADPGFQARLAQLNPRMR